ncbi:MAG: shikimate dehydrogenase [Phycisphaeraceae bacterium]
MTRLAASSFVRTLEQALADAARAAEFGAELIEYRIDQFTGHPDAVVELVQRSALPCILTCRPTWEGGLYDGDESTRYHLLAHALSAARPPAYVDLELAAYQDDPAARQLARQVAEAGDSAAATGLILSTHAYQGRPPQLHQKLAAMADAPECRVIKVAWHARSLRDNLEAFEILAQQYKPTIALCMGEFGLPSRVLAKKFAGLLTFAALDRATATAPSQPTLDELKHLYRWDATTPDTRVFGVIGDPVAHSMSPAIHNAAFDATGYDGVYLPLRIPPEYEHFKATVATWLDHPALHFSGASVTIPHKQNLMRFVEQAGGEIEELAQTIGAANTLIRRADDSLYACNTDYAAALDAVCEALGIARDALKDRRVAVLGAGGAARAIVAGFAHYGATVAVYNRTPEKAQQLAEAFNGRTGKVVAAPLDKLADCHCSIIINCTPIGMHPNTDASPLDGHDMKQWGEGTLVFDTIYNPPRTKLLQQAETAGCATVSGVEMFVRQGAAQFEHWTGKPAPLDVFRRVMHERLHA